MKTTATFAFTDRCRQSIEYWLETGMALYDVKSGLTTNKRYMKTACDFGFTNPMHIRENEIFYALDDFLVEHSYFAYTRFVSLLKHFIEREIVSAWKETENLDMLEEGYGYDVEYLTYEDLWNYYITKYKLPKLYLDYFLSNEYLINELKQFAKEYSYALQLDENGFKAVLTYFGEDE